ncbi:aspartate-semialdehyde dehydrogenase [Oceanirhabdus sp. W0125-5]|uniref:aspartate-semialdehyde dehydrogenase n=1 Tax=Oceanirhabdus sp. W0125-5 TaxID=2999116 RepID=UPI0022F302EE|nr:aspartate-semialdehyde dehydrogenase [Oceanirhabdus sp. W0125-5]WBW97506.1 aspartate-semialdehyde dehydrogenase [Oceanirhabdus sp. W0125-5]
MENKVKVGILGATGFVGQRLAVLLENHPFFDVEVIAASPASKGKKYCESIEGRWKLNEKIPEYIKNMTLESVQDIEKISKKVQLVFCALKLSGDEIRKIEEEYAKQEVVVVSNNSAHRGTEDVPVLIPELNNQHLNIIEAQKKRLGSKKGFIVAKPNCSLQSYLPAVYALREFEPEVISLTTYQAVSGSGKRLEEYTSIHDNIIPYIGGEEEKTEKESLKILGVVSEEKIQNAQEPIISSQCVRVPVSEGHLAAVSIKFKKRPSKEEIIEKWNNFKADKDIEALPMSPEKLLVYKTEEDRPQTALDRDEGKGMSITIGRLREDNIFDYKFICLSHNTLRGAAGGAMLTAELLKVRGLV